MGSILKRIKKNGCVLMLDFDGTLAPIVAHHDAARMSSDTRELLRNAALRFPVAVISGRSLSDVSKRVDLPISYVGSHGLEFRVVGAGPKTHVTIPRASKRTLMRSVRASESVVRKYPGVSIEKKSFSFALHYRALSPKRARQFVREVLGEINPYVRPGGLRVLNDLYTLDVAPDLMHNKGPAIRALHHALRLSPSSIPVYIGDSATDEDAFRSLENGISIRIGKSKTSSAQYYFKTRADVSGLLRDITNIDI